MAVKDRQKLITEIVSTILKEPAQTKTKFDWFINKHDKLHFGKHYERIDAIFLALGGDSVANQTKRTVALDCDAYFGGKYNFIFEFDEVQHFSTARLKTFNFYPKKLNTNFDIGEWEKNCKKHNVLADRYRHSKSTTDFNFAGGRTAQRAYLDCFRDLLPEIHSLNPTVRINQFEVSQVYSNDQVGRKIVEQLLRNRIS